jgi:hypothetical protein
MLCLYDLQVNRSAAGVERGLGRLLVTWKESAMPLIKPRTRGKQLVRYIARLERENNETLRA